MKVVLPEGRKDKKWKNKKNKKGNPIIIFEGQVRIISMVMVRKAYSETSQIYMMKLFAKIAAKSC